MTEFESFLSFFPEVSPPITLTDESIDHINSTNDPLPSLLIDKYIIQWENSQPDEFTEYVPCFKFPTEHKIYYLVYWKASLLRYDYMLASLDEKGTLINLKPLCGTIVEDDIIKKSVANIDEEYVIHIVAGAHKLANGDYDGSYSQTFWMEMMPNGEIVFMKEN